MSDLFLICLGGVVTGFCLNRAGYSSDTWQFWAITIPTGIIFVTIMALTK